MVITFVKNFVPKASVPPDRLELIKRKKYSMPMVTRQMEDSFLRTPFPGSSERECGNGENCQGRKIPNCKPVTLVEFILTKDQVGVLMTNFATGETKSGTRKLDSEDAELCVMCKRYTLMHDWVNLRAECGHLPGDWLVQTYYNVSDLAGQYILEQMFMSSSKEYQGVILPVVLHIAPWYKQVFKDGAWYFEQRGYVLPEKILKLPASNRNF